MGGVRRLATSKNWELVRPALLHDLFCSLDKNADGCLNSLEFRDFIEIMAGGFVETPGWSSKPVKPWMREWKSEEHASEIWQEQFREFCQTRNLATATGLNESDFLKYADDCS